MQIVGFNNLNVYLLSAFDKVVYEGITEEHDKYYDKYVVYCSEMKRRFYENGERRFPFNKFFICYFFLMGGSFFRLIMSNALASISYLAFCHVYCLFCKKVNIVRLIMLFDGFLHNSNYYSFLKVHKINCLCTNMIWKGVKRMSCQRF